MSIRPAVEDYICRNKEGKETRKGGTIRRQSIRCEIEGRMWTSLYCWLLVILIWSIDIELLTKVTYVDALKVVYCGLQVEMASIGNNFTFYRELDALYHQHNDLQPNHLSPSSPTFASLPRGVVVSTWNSQNTSRYSCQLESQRKFCEKYNYTYRMFAGTEEFNKEVSLLPYLLNDLSLSLADRYTLHCCCFVYLKRADLNLPPHWMKVQAIRKIMSEQPRVPWILYLDTDSMIIENKSLPENPIETLLTANNDTHPDSFLFLPSMGLGWNTDFLFVLNNARSRVFMDYAWKLALNCPNCAGEQCALNLAFRDLLLFQANKSLTERPGAVDPFLHVYYDPNVRGSCCEVVRYCEWPRGRSEFRNPFHWSAVQGCVWNWEKVLRWVDNSDVSNEPEEHDLYYYVNRRPYREILGIHHPVKTEAECILKRNFDWGNSTKYNQTDGSKVSAGNDIRSFGNVSESSTSSTKTVVNKLSESLVETNMAGPSLSEIRSDYFRTIGESPDV